MEMPRHNEHKASFTHTEVPKTNNNIQSSEFVFANHSINVNS